MATSQSVTVQKLNSMSVQFVGWFSQVTHHWCQATPCRVRGQSPFQPTVNGTLVNCVTRGKMWPAEAFEVPNAIFNTRKVAVCSPLTWAVVEFHSRNRGKATSGDWAPRPVAVCFKERSKDLYEIVHNLVEAGLGGKRWGWCHCVDSARDGRPPDVRGVIQILGTGIRPMAWPRSVRRVCLRLGRDQLDECAYSLSEVSPFSVLTACRRSVFISIDRVVQLR